MYPDHTAALEKAGLTTKGEYPTLQEALTRIQANTRPEIRTKEQTPLEIAANTKRAHDCARKPGFVLVTVLFGANHSQQD